MLLKYWLISLKISLVTEDPPLSEISQSNQISKPTFNLSKAFQGGPGVGKKTGTMRWIQRWGLLMPSGMELPMAGFLGAECGLRQIQGSPPSPTPWHPEGGVWNLAPKHWQVLFFLTYLKMIQILKHSFILDLFVCVWICAHKCHCPWNLEVGIGFLEAGAVSCPIWVLGFELSCLQVHHALN